jgi:hypothetical protein
VPLDRLVDGFEEMSLPGGCFQRARLDLRVPGADGHDNRGVRLSAEKPFDRCHVGTVRDDDVEAAVRESEAKDLLLSARGSRKGTDLFPRKIDLSPFPVTFSPPRQGAGARLRRYEQMDSETADDIKRHFDAVTGGLRSEMLGVAEGLRSEFGALRDEIRAVDEKSDRRFDELKRHFNVIGESLRSEIGTVAEGFVSTNERLDRMESATSERFGELEVMIRLSFGELERRIQ